VQKRFGIGAQKLISALYLLIQFLTYGSELYHDARKKIQTGYFEIAANQAKYNRHRLYSTFVIMLSSTFVFFIPFLNKKDINQSDLFILNNVNCFLVSPLGIRIINYL